MLISVTPQGSQLWPSDSAELIADAHVPEQSVGADSSERAGASTDRVMLPEALHERRIRRSVADAAAAARLFGSAAEPDAAAEAGARAPRAAEAEEIADIDAALRGWVDPRKAVQYVEHPGKLLNAVSDHYGRTVPFNFEASPDPRLLEDERVFDATAVLYRRLKDNAFASSSDTSGSFGTSSTSSTSSAGPAVSLAELRSAFTAALRENHTRRAALGLLLAPSGKSGQQTPFFDGFALRNAQRKTFDELMALPEVAADPVFMLLSPEQRRGLLQQRFDEIGESTLYRIGTPEHSLATALLRIQSYRGKALPPGLDNRETLIKTFRQIEQEWEREPFYPYHPRLLFAAHLARTDSVELLSIDDHSSKALMTEVVAYGNERLFGRFGVLPAFDRGVAAVAILRGHGLSDEQIDHSRNYVIGGDNPNLSKSAFGDLVDEFLDRADWSGLLGSPMWLPTRARIVPRDELQAAEERFNVALPAQPSVIAYARENVWDSGQPLTRNAVTEEAERLAAGLAAETERHRSWMRGFETWINTVPVIGATYNIEEGVRHHDATRAALGLLFLGIDLFDLTTGSGGGGGARRTHPLAVKVQRALLHVDASMGDVLIHPAIVDAATDPVDIARRDSDIPERLLSLAERARAGERHIRWREHDVVHLEDEDRIGFVTNDDGVYSAVDWRTGRRSRKGTIERDTLTGRFYSRKTSAARSADDDSVRGSDVETRLTVDGVKAVLKGSNDAGMRDFEEIFDGCFVIRSPVAVSFTFDAKAFYANLYRNSRTFRRLVNHFDDAEGCARNATTGGWKKWELLVADVGPLGSPTKAHTDFDHRRIYLPKDDDIATMPYITASGSDFATSEHVYLHEMIHALTGARDPERMLAMLNRGPVVYLTDKILSEGGYRFAEQVMYRRADSLPDMPPHETTGYHREAATLAAHDENRYLDPFVDGKSARVPNETLVEGLPVADRQTVREVQDVVVEAAAGEDDVFVSMYDFETKFRQNFAFVTTVGAADEVSATDAKVVVDFLRRLFRKSSTFGYLMRQMPMAGDSGNDAVWRFILDETPPADGLLQGASRHGPGINGRRIYVNGPDAAYLSEAGLRDVEFERQLTYDMVRAMGGFASLSPDAAYLNRGAAVYFTDAILSEAGFHFPRQLSAALAPAGDAAARRQLLATQTSAQRSAALEDRFLHWRQPLFAT